jgi:hypothetical protein
MIEPLVRLALVPPWLSCVAGWAWWIAAQEGADVLTGRLTAGASFHRLTSRRCVPKWAALGHP